jgi:hypothetical protein
VLHREIVLPVRQDSTFPSSVSAKQDLALALLGISSTSILSSALCVVVIVRLASTTASTACPALMGIAYTLIDSIVSTL